MAAATEVQKALYLALAALGLTVHDAAPQATDGGADTPFPYVEVGLIDLGMMDTYGEAGFDAVARIHVRSRSAAMKETKDIQGQIYDRLHRGSLTITGYRFILMQCETSIVTRAPDGSFHGIDTYRIQFDRLV